MNFSAVLVSRVLLLRVSRCHLHVPAHRLALRREYWLGLEAAQLLSVDEATRGEEEEHHRTSGCADDQRWERTEQAMYTSPFSNDAKVGAYGKSFARNAGLLENDEWMRAWLHKLRLTLWPFMPKKVCSIPRIPVTLDTSQSLSGWLKALA